VAAVNRALAIAAVLTAASSAAAQEEAQEAPPASEAHRLIDEARRAYSELDFALAIDAAQRALATPGLDDAERASALETMGCAYVVLDREAPAREAFESLFRLDPYWAVREPSGSPRIARFVESVRGAIVEDAALDPGASLRLDLPRGARTGREISIAAIAEGATPARVVLRVRGEGEIEWTRVEARREGDRFAIEIPARSEAEELDVYAEARDARGRLIARAGGPLAPYHVPVRPGGGGEDELTSEWWFWLAVGGGAVLVGGAIAIGAAVGGQERAQPGTLDPGIVRLPLVAF
jgi:hypothetical protein